VIDLDKVRQLCASIAERTGPDGHPDVLTLLAAMSDTLDAFEAERREHAQWAFNAGQATGEYLRERDDELKTARGEVERLQAELDRAITRANHNARLAADNADERDTATRRERERIANWFLAEGERWRINNDTEAECEYDRAADMVRDSAGGEG
jgi:hypothetical protein